MGLGKGERILNYECGMMSDELGARGEKVDGQVSDNSCQLSAIGCQRSGMRGQGLGIGD